MLELILAFVLVSAFMYAIGYMEGRKEAVEGNTVNFHRGYAEAIEDAQRLAERLNMKAKVEATSSASRQDEPQHTQESAATD